MRLEPQAYVTSIDQVKRIFKVNARKVHLAQYLGSRTLAFVAILNTLLREKAISHFVSALIGINTFPAHIIKSAIELKVTPLSFSAPVSIDTLSAVCKIQLTNGIFMRPCELGGNTF